MNLEKQLMANQIYVIKFMHLLIVVERRFVTNTVNIYASTILNMTTSFFFYQTQLLANIN